ncbi:hypothetical protein EDB92DRAFT_298859 [Lactarius akahatsu]|uniref:Uncharacterized protein n=1 Tax=Lactarius akahatsu TaxID=416441 RepID=A0AAD4L8Z4_9AGAM|nr:hypothetical protein EDB92DRAFT_298859 [Lactarius akahatsu]
MAPKRLTKAKSLQFPFSTKRLYSSTTAKPHAVLVLALGLTDKEANPGGDYNKDDPTSAQIESSTPPSVSSHVSETTRRKNLGENGSPPGARSQPNTSISAVHEQLPDTQSDQPYIPPQRRRCDRSRPLSFSGESPTPAVQSEMPPPFPPLRHSERTSEGKALLPVVPLDIKIDADQSRGTKRSAAISAQSRHPKILVSRDPGRWPHVASPASHFCAVKNNTAGSTVSSRLRRLHKKNCGWP